MKPNLFVPRGQPRARMMLALVAALTLTFNPMNVLASGVVTNATEAALRAALAGGGTVTVQCNGTIALTNTLVITNTTTLTATGYDLTISGSNAVRLFWVKSNVNLTLLNLKLADGYAVGEKGTPDHPDGWPGAGGAIHNDGGGVVAVGCSFLRNEAVGGAGNDSFDFLLGPGNGSVGMGGAIYSLFGSVALTNTSFQGNHARGGAGGVGNAGGSGGIAQGGAIYLANSTLNQQGSLLASNLALGGLPGGAMIRRRGGDAFGGAVFQTNGVCRTEKSVFTGNDSRAGLGGLASGGAFYQTAGDSVWAGSSFYSNRAIGGAALVSERYSQSPGDGVGGGVSSAGTLSMLNSTVAGNTAQGGAGYANLPGMPVPGFPDGASLGGGLNLGGSAVLNSVTVANNSAQSGGGGVRGAATLRNTLLAFNGGGNFGGTVADEGNNLSSDSSPVFTAAGSLSATDPRLGLLGNLGGPTPTIPLLGGSPAIDAGNPAWCPPTDQRGVARPVGAACDIGAFEGSIPNYPQLAMTLTPALAATGSVVVLTYTLSNPNTNALSNVSFANTLPPELRVASVPGVVNGCGSGAINAVAGGGLVTVTNVSLAAQQSCSFAVNVVGPTAGLVTNTAGPVSSAETGPGAAIASAVVSLASSIAGPSVVTGPASNVQEHSATLTGTVNPNGATATAWFEYGATTNYGSMSSIINLAAGYVAANVAADLANLPTKAAVHYRLVAQNIAGTTYGADQIFSVLSFGATNFALQFDGVDDRVQIGQGGGMDGLTQGTIEMWVRWNGVQPTEPTYGLHGAIFSRYGSYGRQTILALDNANPALAHVTWSPYSTARALTGQRLVGDGVWHHVAVTFAPGVQRLYLDGVLEASGTQNGVLGTDPNGYVSLASLANTTVFARCTLDEVRVWSMARNDIAYNMRRPLDSATPGLIGYWRLDEGGGSVAHDATGHGYDGALFNGPLWVQPTNTMAYGLYVSSSRLGNQLRVTLTGQPNQSFVLQRSTDLINWIGVVTNTLGANGQYLYTDPSINSAPQRLYRVRTP